MPAFPYEGVIVSKVMRRAEDLPQFISACRRVRAKSWNPADVEDQTSGFRSYSTRSVESPRRSFHITIAMLFSSRISNLKAVFNASISLTSTVQAQLL